MPRRDPLHALVVFTRDRPAAALRCVRSLIGDTQCASAAPIHVFDDARGPTDALDDVERETSGRADVVSRRDRALLCAALADRLGVDAEPISAALLGTEDTWSIGAARNAALLLTVGRPLMTVDDDVVGPALRLRGDAAPVQSRAYDPTTLTYYASREEALAAAQRRCVERVHPATAHDTVLGRRVGGDSSRRVRASMLGMAGDGGTSFALMRLLERGDARRRLLADYERLRLSRAVVRCVSRPTIGGGLFMTPCAAYDTTELLPPFPASGRNAEGAFALLLRAVDTRGAIGYAPYVVRHDPVPRSIGEYALHTVGSRPPVSTLFTIILADCVAQLPKTLSGIEPRLRRVGALLVERAQSSLPEFAATVRAASLRHARSAVSHLTQQLDASAADTPTQYLLDVERARDTIRHAAEDPAYPFVAPHDLLRTRLRRYGQLCLLWPDLWQAAASLQR